MPDFVVSRVMEVLNQYREPLKGSRILILGLAYKANVDDDREPPTYRLMEKLEEKGASVSYNHPHVPMIEHVREHPALAGRRSVEITADYDSSSVPIEDFQYI